MKPELYTLRLSKYLFDRHPAGMNLCALISITIAHKKTICFSQQLIKVNERGLIIEVIVKLLPFLRLCVIIMMNIA